MKTYKNSIGCIMSFDDDISQEEINKRLSWYGNAEDFKEVVEIK